MDPIYLAAMSATCALVIGAICVTTYRFEIKRRSWQHIERMKALELGSPLPDAEVARTTAIASIAILVSLFTLASAVGTSALVVAHEFPYRLALLATLWGVCGLVCLAVSVQSLVRLDAPRRRRPDKDEQEPARSDEPEPVGAGVD